MLNRAFIFGIVCCGLLGLITTGLPAQTRTAAQGFNDFESIWDGEMGVLLNTPLPGEMPYPPSQLEDASDALLGKKIVSVEAVSPPKGFDPVADLALQLGTRLSRSLARQMVMTLWESGRYRNVQISGRRDGSDGVVILIRVEPMFRISRFEISGNEALNDTEVKRAIGYASGGTIVPDNKVMLEIRDRLLREYGKRGYNEATASVRLETTNTVSELALLIDVAEGEPDRYVDVKIQGLTNDLSQEQLLRVSGLKRGIVREEEAVRQGLEKLSKLLFELGYPDARISDDYTEQKIGKNQYVLRISADIGLKSIVEFRGNEKLRARDLREIIWQPGFRTDARSVSAALTKLEQYAVSKGLFHVKVEAFRQCFANPNEWYTVTIDKACTRKRVTSQAVVFVMEEGPQVEVVDIQIEGASYFGISYLKDEIFAFMAEKNNDDAVFEEFSTRALNDAVAGPDAAVARRRARGASSVYSKPETVYDPEKYLEATQHIEDIYLEQGFLKVHVADTCVLDKQAPVQWKGEMFSPVFYKRDIKRDEKLPPCLFMNADGTSVIVRFSIQEGIQTLIERIDFQGNTPTVFMSSELLRIGGLSFGQPFNEYFIRDAADLILQAYQEKGYMFANVTWDTAISTDQTNARVIIHIDEGPTVRVNKILVSSDRTNKWFIRDNLGFKSGDLVTPSRLTSARQRVMDLGVFNSATVQMQSPGIVSEKKNILVSVVERNAQYLELRAGVATEEGVRGGFEYGHRNIFGLAINYRLKIRANYRPEDIWFFGSEAEAFKVDLNARYQAYNDTHSSPVADMFKWFEWYLLTGFRTSNIPGTSGLLGTGVDVTLENINRRGYSALKVTPRYRLTSHYLKYLPIELSTGIDGTIVLPASALGTESLAASSYARLPSGRAVFWVTSLSAALDFRDSPLDPREGIFLALKGDYIHSIDKYTERQKEGVVQRSRYIRFTGSLSGYIPFVDKRNVLALSTSVGYIFHLRDNSITWADRYFYMGGVSTLRGFRSDTLRPEDMPPYYAAPDTGDSGSAATGSSNATLIQEYGGEAMFLLRSELRHDFGKNIVGVIFLEAGNLWRKAENFLMNNRTHSPSFRLRPTTGAGLHYNTPVGPLAFDVGINLKRNKDLTLKQNSGPLAEELWAWYFSIGSAF